MDYFGLTAYGFDNPIRDFMRADYKEPTIAPKSYKDIYSKFQKTLSERLKELDVYLGRADGYSYNSYEKLNRMRIKGVLKPIGPSDMYARPGTTAMDYGWFYSDDNLKKNDWHKNREYHRFFRSEMSWNRDQALLRVPNFKFAI